MRNIFIIVLFFTINTNIFFFGERNNLVAQVDQEKNTNDLFTLKKMNQQSILNGAAIQSMFIDNNILYVSVRNYGIYAFDITNPLAAKQIRDPIQMKSPTRGIVKIDNYLYVSDYYDGVVVIDVSYDKQNNYGMKLVMNIPLTSGNALDMKKDKNNILYVASGTGGVKIFETQSRTSIFEIPQNEKAVTTINAGCVFLKDKYLIVGDNNSGLFVFEIQNKDNIVFTSVYVSKNSDALAKDLIVDSSAVYIASDRGGIEVVLRKDHRVNSQLASADESADYNRVVLQYEKHTNYFFTGGGKKTGLKVYTKENSNKVKMKDQIYTDDITTCLTQKGHYIYVGTGQSGVLCYFFDVKATLKTPFKNLYVREEDELKYKIPDVIDEDDEEKKIEFVTRDGYPNPDGVSITKDDFFQWTPTKNQEGRYDFYMKINNVMNPNVYLIQEIPFTVSVLHKTFPPKFPKTETKFTINENQKINILAPLASIEEQDKYLYEYQLENMPLNAVYLRELRTISWKPDFDQSGKYNILLTVFSQRNELSDTIEYMIDVKNVNRPPGFVNMNDEYTGDEEKTMIIPIQTVDADQEDQGNIAMRCDNLPSGAKIKELKPGLFQLEWTPKKKQTGIYDVSFTVSDAGFDENSVKGKNILTITKNIKIKIYHK